MIFRSKSPNSDLKTTETYIICDCHCSRLFFSKTSAPRWDDDYTFSFVKDYNKERNYNIFQRIWAAIKDKPLYYAETTTTDKERVLEFLHDCIDIIGEEDAGTQN